MPQAPPAPPSGSPPDEMDVLKLHLREVSCPMGNTGGVSDGGVEVEHLEAPSVDLMDGRNVFNPISIEKFRQE